MRELEETRPCAEEIGRHRAKLMNFARRRLRDPAQAEDAVQETLVAALESAGGFAAGSSLGTWLIGILRHKIVDCVRKSASQRWQAMDPDELVAGSGDPEAALSERGFFERLERCIEDLPARAARVFVLRQVLGMNTAEVCAQLAISSTNCSVLMHRARMQLRASMAAERQAASG